MRISYSCRYCNHTEHPAVWLISRTEYSCDLSWWLTCMTVDSWTQHSFPYTWTCIWCIKACVSFKLFSPSKPVRWPNETTPAIHKDVLWYMDWRKTTHRCLLPAATPELHPELKGDRGQDQHTHVHTHSPSLTYLLLSAFHCWEKEYCSFPFWYSITGQSKDLLSVLLV